MLLTRADYPVFENLFSKSKAAVEWGVDLLLAAGTLRNGRRPSPSPILLARDFESDYRGVLIRILQDHYRNDFLLWNVHLHPMALQGFRVEDYFGKGTVRNVV
jgi:hypothetical protein